MPSPGPNTSNAKPTVRHLARSRPHPSDSPDNVKRSFTRRESVMAAVAALVVLAPLLWVVAGNSADSGYPHRTVPGGDEVAGGEPPCGGERGRPRDSAETAAHGSSPTPHRMVPRKVAAVPKVGARFRDCARCPEMVVVPAGSFLMGSPESEKGHVENEGPVHRVRIAAPFAVGVYEVTFEEWDACGEDGGCRGHEPETRWGRGRRPVINVSWEDAQAYVGWLSAKTGKRYRLPSESEWEYAARAGTRTSRPWGDSESEECRYANGVDDLRLHDYRNGREVVAEVAECDDGYKMTAPVGRYEANAWGLHDVLGNVWEWTEDCWHVGYAGAPADGSAWESGGCSRRVLRGGSCRYSPKFRLRSALRTADAANNRERFTGFRVARTLTP